LIALLQAVKQIEEKQLGLAPEMYSERGVARQ